MREDMSKVIVERPRTGRAVAGLRPGRTRALADDDGEPIRAKGAREPKGRAQKTKRLNETLNPLKRYLASNIGRPWNKVFSEISEHLKPRSTVQQHVRDHVTDFVATKTHMKAGVVVVSSSRHGGERPLSEHWSLFYVHPRTGLLRKNEFYRRIGAVRREARIKAEAELAKRMREIDARTQLHLFKEDWWEVKLAKVQAVYHDVVHSAKLSKLPAEELYGRHGVHACDKRQLSKAEIKRLKLR